MILHYENLNNVFIPFTRGYFVRHDFLKYFHSCFALAAVAQWYSMRENGVRSQVATNLKKDR